MVSRYPPNESFLKLDLRTKSTFRQCHKGAVQSLALFVVLFVLDPSESMAQFALHGMVVDSATMEPLQHVNVTIKTTGPGTVSDLRGSFTLNAGEADTILFSRVGYKSVLLPAVSVSQMVLILLKEERKILDAIEIDDKKPSWLPELPPVSAWRNQTLNKSFTEIPGFQGFQTFGPGYAFQMPGSGFKKEARAKKNLQQVTQENDKARDYIHLVNSPEIRGKIMADYDLSEEKFYELLAIFNEETETLFINWKARK